MCSPLEQAGKERERVKEREKGEPYTRIPNRGHPSGDGNPEVGVGSGAGNVGPQCAGMPGLCVSPSNNEVELLLFFALSSEHPHHLCLSEDCCGLEDWSN